MTVDAMRAELARLEALRGLVLELYAKMRTQADKLACLRDAAALRRRAIHVRRSIRRETRRR